MIYSKTIIDNVLNFLSANLEAELLSWESHTSTTVDRLTYFDIVKHTQQYEPFAILYENETPYARETLKWDTKTFKFSLDIKDARTDIDKMRNNLYAYRDVFAKLIEENSELGNAGGVAWINLIKPPLIMSDETGTNYNGVIEIQFQFECVNI